MEIGAPLGSALLTTRLLLMEHVREQITEGRRRRAADADGEIEPFEADGGRLVANGALAGGVVTTATLGVAQCFVRFGNLTKVSDGRPIARIDVRVILPRQPLVGALDV